MACGNALPTLFLGEVTCINQSEATVQVPMMKHSDQNQGRGGDNLSSLQFQISVHHGESQRRN